MRVIAHYGNGLERVIQCPEPKDVRAAIKAALAYDRGAQFTIDKRVDAPERRRAPTERAWLLAC